MKIMTKLLCAIEIDLIAVVYYELWWMVKIWFPQNQNTFFSDFILEEGIYYGLLYIKTWLGIPIWPPPPKPLKTVKNVNLKKNGKL